MSKQAPPLRSTTFQGTQVPAIAAVTSRRLSQQLGWTAKLQTGIVGLPNVGKSTLFNALLQKATAEAANFPFCTIEPNTGIVSVPDPRLDVLAKLASSVKVVPATMEFVDIAGIVKGASEGAGLGNKFLANIRECDAIIHVVRCFQNDDIIHVDGSIDPVRDMDVINLELILADMVQVMCVLRAHVFQSQNRGAWGVGFVHARIQTHRHTDAQSHRHTDTQLHG